MAQFHVSAAPRAALLLVTIVACLSGCTSSNTGEPQSPYSATMVRPMSPDVYPVIEGRLPAANQQMTNEEAASQEARLSSLSHARASGSISSAEYKRKLLALQALGASHGPDTLREIGN